VAVGDLTTLANLKAWLGVANSNSDLVLSRLVSAASQQIRTYTSRYSFAPRDYTEVRDGPGTSQLVPLNWPVTDVSSVSIGALSVPQAEASTSELDFASGAGWSLQAYDGNPPGQPQIISLVGYIFHMGRQNITLVYRAGYEETDSVPAASGYVAAAPQGSWSLDTGVTYAATGVALQSVPAAPSAGQYAVSGGVYTFAPADLGTPVDIRYGFAPSDLEQACIDLAAFKYAGSQRIGIRSKSLGGQETVAFDTAGIPESVAAALQPYISVQQFP